MPTPDRLPTLVVMGPSGCGKSTLARALATQLGRRFIEADDLHPAANVAKMAAGQPLDDADRAPWLARVADEIARAGDGGAVVSCSALKRAYRDRLRAAGPALRFVLPDVDPGALARRVAARAAAHFMPASLVASQLATLEPAGAGEDLLQVDGMAPTADQVEAVLAGAGRLVR